VEVALHQSEARGAPRGPSATTAPEDDAKALPERPVTRALGASQGFGPASARGPASAERRTGTELGSVRGCFGSPAGLDPRERVQRAGVAGHGGPAARGTSKGREAQGVEGVQASATKQALQDSTTEQDLEGGVAQGQR
jgi:hypothetical protein